jgi:divinyl protochlorophyllide a 8-vinyl-reductase
MAAARALSGNAAPSGRVGPNAVIQLANALAEGLGPEAASRVFGAAGCAALLEKPPEEMIDERVPARLFEALWRTLPDATARWIAEDAGRRTGAYIVKNRIPVVAKGVLRLLPRSLAARFLTAAIARHAWTFAGSGACRALPGEPVVIEIADNPIVMPACVWHQAVFTALFGELVGGDVTVRHNQCCRTGAETCRFEVTITPAHATSAAQPSTRATPSGTSA